MPEVLEAPKNKVAVMTPAEFLPITKQSGIEKAETYAAMFAPFMIKVKELSNKAATINKENPTALDAKLAREIRLAMVKNRTATGDKKDQSKAALIAESNLIQGLHNVVISTSQLAEADMAAVEKFAEIKEAARVKALQNEREDLLAPYVDDAAIFPLGTMTAEQFETMLEGYKLILQQKIEAQQKAEAERLAKEAAEKLEQERIKQENERLKAEAEAKEKALEAEREEVARLAKIEADKQAAILKEQQEAAAKEAARVAKENAEKLAAIEAANKAAREKAAAEQAEQAERERLAKIEADRLKAEADKLAAELKAKQDAEKAAAAKLEAEKAAKAAAEKKAAKAPDKDKLKSVIELMPALNMPVFNTVEASTMSDQIRAKYNAFKQWALTQIETL